MANLAQTQIQTRSLCPACRHDGDACDACGGLGYRFEWVSLVELQARLLPAKAPACACCCTCSDLGLNPDCPVPDHAARAWQLEKDMAL